MKKVILVLTVSVFYIACTGSREAMNAWLGHSKQELIAKYGQPDRDESDGRTGSIMVYANKTSRQNGNTYDYKIFYLNSKQNVYSTLTKTVNTPPAQINLSSFKRY